MLKRSYINKLTALALINTISKIQNTGGSFNVSGMKFMQILKLQSKWDSVFHIKHMNILSPDETSVKYFCSFAGFRGRFHPA